MMSPKESHSDPRMKFLILAIWCVALVCLTPGCKRKKGAPPAPSEQGQATSVEPSAASASPVPAPPPPPVTAAAPENDSQGSSPSPGNVQAAVQQELLRLKPPQGDGQVPSEKAIIWAVDRFDEKYFRYPKDIDELVKVGLLKPLPAPPPGKKYLLDSHNRTLSLVDK